MRLMQVRDGRVRRVIASDRGKSWIVGGRTQSVLDLARAAIAKKTSIAKLVRAAPSRGEVDPAAYLAKGRVLPPVDHPDPAHLLVTGTGLSHLGSAATRDSMHAKATADEAALTDSMKMFRMGLEGGKPAKGETGVQPEWFYKGDGSFVAAPGKPLVSPAFALDSGEEPEIAGVYLVGRDGQPWRIGFALINEFSDHVTERQNYLYLAHSKLRPCSFGPELLLGELPDDIEGVSRIRRGDTVIFEQPFLTGEANMSHSIANLEAHHFKYPYFRRPGDVHVHCFGTATLSFAAGIRTQAGDVFEISAPQFGLPLVNPLAVGEEERVRIRRL